MEKQIKMSLTTAREIYKQLTDMRVIDKSGEATLSRNQTPNEALLQLWLLENFTKEELEEKKGFSWEDSFDGDGYYISPNSDVIKTTCNHTEKHCKNIFKTREQAESALAFAQLTHICAKYNNHPTNPEQKYLNTILCINNRLVCNEYHHNQKLPLFFYTRENAKTSMEVNRELWEKYHMIKL